MPANKQGAPEKIGPAARAFKRKKVQHGKKNQPQPYGTDFALIFDPSFFSTVLLNLPTKISSKS
ncbi:hypothetical protein DLM77_20660 [Leptospira yasudae]|uniref:Uncharacterized protein n=1 Tax=Leptospira yasudae TaxID=2202201 RepID=A0ABX9LY95_9LEPT|nr:hypothetical protein DLM77_20660 [Leptospira yasudae]